jgi:hypothetical protein
MRKFLLAVTLAATVALGVPVAASAAPAPSAPTAPARVAPQGGGFTLRICFPTYVNPPGVTVWHCFTIQVPALEAGLGPGDCPQCGFGILQTYDPSDLKSQPVVEGDLGQGFVQLGEAAVASTPADAAKLHTTAVNTFIAAARALGSAKLGEKAVGFLDPASGKFDPEPQPWRQQAGADVTNAVSLLQSYLLKQDPTVLASATARLDAAYTILAKNAASPTG